MIQPMSKVKIKNPHEMKSRGILVSNETWARLDAVRKEWGSIEMALRMLLAGRNGETPRNERAR